MENKLPRYYYSASNADGSISTSRIGADSDADGIAKIRAYLAEVGVTSLDGIDIWRSYGVGSSSQPVRLAEASQISKAE